MPEESKSERRASTIFAAATAYTIGTLVVITVAVWGINRIAVTRAHLEVTCHFRCLQRCAIVEIPGTPIPEGLPRRLAPGGPSCSEICSNQCGREVLSSSACGSGQPQRIFYDDFDSDAVASPPFHDASG